MVKRLFDIAFSFLGLAALFPLFVLIIILMKLDSKGPVFYKGERIGKDGKPFKMYKFRTMSADADRMGDSPSCADDDPRITRIGAFLRKYKLNEIPQLINVLNGEMSFVGPRPEVPSEVETYSEEERRILTVKPGITDYASIAFHNEGEILKGSSDPHQAYREKIKPGKLRLALKYVDESSFWVDLKILLGTFLTLVRTRSPGDK
jgi:lipopolysaccharide/colanic/teichoic acid biosynthesis glycosyltransferase